MNRRDTRTSSTAQEASPHVLPPFPYAENAFAPIITANTIGFHYGKHHQGYVSLEVNPHLAHDTQGSVREARRLWVAPDRPNVFIKVTGTSEGPPVIQQLISEGINIDKVTQQLETAGDKRFMKAAPESGGPYGTNAEQTAIRGLFLHGDRD